MESKQIHKKYKMDLDNVLTSFHSNEHDYSQINTTNNITGNSSNESRHLTEDRTTNNITGNSSNESRHLTEDRTTNNITGNSSNELRHLTEDRTTNNITGNLSNELRHLTEDRTTNNITGNSSNELRHLTEDRTTNNITGNSNNELRHLTEDRPTTSLSSSSTDDEESDNKRNNLSLRPKRDISEYTWRDMEPLPHSRYDEKKSSIIFTYSNVSQPEHFSIMSMFVQKMNATMEMEWSDRITHLVVGTNINGTCRRTKKVFNAVLANNYIININWMKDCLESGIIISEFYYTPKEAENEHTFVNTLWVRLDTIYSPLEWIQYSVFYIYPVVVKRQWHDLIVEWINKLGGKIINRMVDFKNYEKSERIILVDVDTEHYNRTLIPCKSRIDQWFEDYGAVTVFMEWMFRSLSNFRRINIAEFLIPPPVSDAIEI